MKAAHPGSTPAVSVDDTTRFIAHAAEVLHANGAETTRVEDRVRQLGAALGVSAWVDLGWSTSDIEVTHRAAPTTLWRFRGAPSSVALNRVLETDRIIDALQDRRLQLTAAWKRLQTASALPPSNLFLFAGACIVGACGLAVVFGVRHPLTLLLIAVCAMAGALARRGLGHLGANIYWQNGAAALLAGLCGAVAGAVGVSSPLGLAAVCPCMILVPGPHLLKGSIDLATLRIPLGLSRLVFASVILLAVTAGLLIGLWVGGADLVADPVGREIPIWIDAPVAGLLAVAYGIFYSAPLRILHWPFLVGTAAHALRWVVVFALHADAWIGAGVACLFVGLVLIPISRWRQLPFAAIGFASVVSLVPGVLIFRAIGGVAELGTATGTEATRLVVESIDNANGALLTIIAMALGFLAASAICSRIPRLLAE